MGKILFLVLLAALACKAEEEYSKYSPNKDSKLVVQYDNENGYKRPSKERKVVVKLNAGDNKDYYDQENYNQNGEHSKIRYAEERNNQEDIYEYPNKDQQYSNDKQYAYKQEMEEKVEKISQPVYVNVNVKKNEQIYRPESKKINVNVKINNDRQDEYNDQDQQHQLSKVLRIYGDKPKKVLINVKLQKEEDDHNDQQAYIPKKININVKVSKIQEPKIFEQKEVRETVLDKLYRVSKKYTGL